ncbi:hypothetical protein BCR35DRAFT_138732 [Leucosporidium creatinivorum]|uniref:Uncharacterized protein n=1 Tax=Leucosporidium creatinivorum TaxID=106004 RepID=A0A1Y2EUC2_9BASI|nr:hypothetical protein BCR35DRAFT_138732 [Leucosporidium creatinivorum]
MDENGELTMQMDGESLFSLLFSSSERRAELTLSSLLRPHSTPQALPSPKELLAASSGTSLLASLLSPLARALTLSLPRRSHQQEASARGDSMEVSLLSNYLKSTMARWFLQMAAGAVSNELEELGLDTRRAMGGAGALGMGDWDWGMRVGGVG